MMHAEFSEEHTRALLSWYRESRRILPWREDATPYRVWVSEIMLQQTRVEAVKAYFLRFMETLPTVSDLASVPDEVLMKLWQGLGYYSRARNLKKAATEIVSRYGGQLPRDEKELLSLPGIGSYTAGAIASIAFGERVPAVDGNVLRVVTRLCRDGRDITLPATKKAIEDWILSVMPHPTDSTVAGKNDCGDFTQAWIELGATVCLPNGEPRCEACPLREICESRRCGDMRAFPVKSPKAARRREEKTVLLLYDAAEKRFALQKRPETGLLASLYEPIVLEGKYTEDELTGAMTDAGIVPLIGISPSPLGEAKHIFTHIEWHMTGYLVPVDMSLQRISAAFLTMEEIAGEYAVPSAYRFFLRKMKEISEAGDGHV